MMTPKSMPTSSIVVNRTIPPRARYAIGGNLDLRCGSTASAGKSVRPIGVAPDVASVASRDDRQDQGGTQ